jgi:hypothetical protein
MVIVIEFTFTLNSPLSTNRIAELVKGKVHSKYEKYGPIFSFLHADCQINVISVI